MITKFLYEPSHYIFRCLISIILNRANIPCISNKSMSLAPMIFIYHNTQPIFQKDDQNCKNWLLEIKNTGEN